MVSNTWDGRLNAGQLTGSFPLFAGGTSGPFYNFATAMAALPAGRHELDPLAMLAVATKGYAFGDRTMVQGLSRLPFMAGVDGGTGEVRQAAEPSHVAVGERSAPPLLELLSDELQQALSGRARVGLLLSGGMDSRIVAGVLHRLQAAGRVSSEIVGVTWGTSDSRDVVYAEFLARALGWQWRHIELTPALLRRNLLLMADAGAEVSPLHLHGLPDVAQMDDLDLVVAGTYGDSIGRAEYSGRHISDLPATKPRVVDPFGVFPALNTRSLRTALRSESTAWRPSAGTREEWQFRELEQQRHYLRRLLQVTMSSALHPLPLYQAFTAPPVYSAMWQLPPQQRGDVHYRTLLAELHPALRDVPWSRTGTRYDGVPGTNADQLRSRHHKYGEWLRGETGSTVESLIVDSPLATHRAYARPLRAGLRNWRKTKTSDYTRLDLLFTWLASLGSMSNRYALDVPSGSSGGAPAYPVGRVYRTAYRLAKDRSAT